MIDYFMSYEWYSATANGTASSQMTRPEIRSAKDILAIVDEIKNSLRKDTGLDVTHVHITFIARLPL